MENRQEGLAISISDKATLLIALWTGGTMGILCTAEYLFGLKYVASITFVGMLLVALTAKLIKQHQPYWGRVLFTLTTNAVVFFATDINGHGPGWYFYYVPAMALPFIMWELQRVRTITLFVLMPITLALIGFFMKRGTFFPSEIMPYEYLFGVSSFILSGLMTTFFMGYYVVRTKTAYDLLAEQQSRAMNSSRLAALGEMAGGIAHEINNPLAIISGYVQQINRQLEDSPEALQKIEKQTIKIENMVQRISKIINGLRSFSRDGSRDPIESFSLQGLIDDSMSLAEAKLKSNGVTMKVLLPNEFIHIRGQKVQLSQVLINLINNAFDAIEHNKEKWILIQAKTIGNKIELSVTDSGLGVPMAVREKLMQPFFTTKPVGKGTGLGLPISKGIVERHQGHFYYDENSKNTRFVIELPFFKEASKVA